MQSRCYKSIVTGLLYICGIILVLDNNFWSRAPSSRQNRISGKLPFERAAGSVEFCHEKSSPCIFVVDVITHGVHFVTGRSRWRVGGRETGGLKVCFYRTVISNHRDYKAHRTYRLYQSYQLKVSRRPNKGYSPKDNVLSPWPQLDDN